MGSKVQSAVLKLGMLHTGPPPRPPNAYFLHHYIDALALITATRFKLFNINVIPRLHNPLFSTVPR